MDKPNFTRAKIIRMAEAMDDDQFEDSGYTREEALSELYFATTLKEAPKKLVDHIKVFDTLYEV